MTTLITTAYRDFEKARTDHFDAVKAFIEACEPYAAEITRRHYPEAVTLSFYCEVGEEWVRRPERIKVTESSGTVHDNDGDDVWMEFEEEILGPLEYISELGLEAGDTFEVRIPKS